MPYAILVPIPYLAVHLVGDRLIRARATRAMVPVFWPGACWDVHATGGHLSDGHRLRTTAPHNESKPDTCAPMSKGKRPLAARRGVVCDGRYRARTCDLAGVIRTL